MSTSRRKHHRAVTMRGLRAAAAQLGYQNAALRIGMSYRLDIEIARCEHMAGKAFRRVRLFSAWSFARRAAAMNAARTHLQIGSHSHE
jgi:hypothetical protein